MALLIINKENICKIEEFDIFCGNTRINNLNDLSNCKEPKTIIFSVPAHIFSHKISNAYEINLGSDGVYQLKISKTKVRNGKELIRGFLITS